MNSVLDKRKLQFLETRNMDGEHKLMVFRVF